MNIAVLFNKDLNFNSHLDDDHPIECREIGTATTYDPKDGKTWTVMSIAAYEALKTNKDKVWLALRDANISVGDQEDITLSKRLADKLKSYFVEKV